MWQFTAALSTRPRRNERFVPQNVDNFQFLQFVQFKNVTFVIITARAGTNLGPYSLPSSDTTQPKPCFAALL